MQWRARYKQRKTISTLFRLFTEDTDFNLATHGMTILDVDLNGMVFHTQRPAHECLKWINANIPSMTDHSWFLYDHKACEHHDKDACGIIFVCCS